MTGLQPGKMHQWLRQPALAPGPLHRSISVGNSMAGLDRLAVGCHPQLWSRNDVRDWITWCVEEYALDGVQLEKFAMNGKALCMLTKDDFNDRATHVGDVIFNTLQTYIACGSPQGVRTYGPPSISIDVRNGAPFGLHHDIFSTPPGSPHDTSRRANLLTVLSTAPYRTGAGTSQAEVTLNGDGEARDGRHVTSHAAPLNLSRPSAIRLAVPSSTSGQRTPSPPQLSPHPARLHADAHHQQSTTNGRQMSPQHDDVTRQANYNQPRFQAPMASPQLSPNSATSSCSPRRAASRSPAGSPAGSPNRPRSPSSPRLSHVVPMRRPSPTGYADVEAPSKQRKMERNNSYIEDRSTLSVPSSPGFINIAPCGDYQLGSSPESMVSVRALTEGFRYITRLTSRDDSPRVAMATTPARDDEPYDVRLTTEPISDAEPEEEAFDGGNWEAADCHNRKYAGRDAASSRVVNNGVHATLPTVITTPPVGGERYRLTPANSLPPLPMQIPIPVRAASEKAEDCLSADGIDADGNPGDPKLLWEFIYQLLRDPEYDACVRWEDESQLIFRIVNPANLASLWGRQKNRANMTYEKLSRALRYYYRMNIIVKVPSRRLTYRFVNPPESIQKGQKGAKPGVSHKRRILLPRDAPRVSSTSETSASVTMVIQGTHDVRNDCDVVCDVERDVASGGGGLIVGPHTTVPMGPSPSNGTLVEQRRLPSPLGGLGGAGGDAATVTSTLFDVLETNVKENGHFSEEPSKTPKSELDTNGKDTGFDENRGAQIKTEDVSEGRGPIVSPADDKDVLDLSSKADPVRV